MIHLVDFDSISSVVTDNHISTFIIPVSADAIGESKFYQAMCSKFPELDSKRNSVIGSREIKPGDSYKLRLDSGHTIYLVMFKKVDKFGAYILDVVNALTTTIDHIKLDHPNLSDCKVLLPLPPSDETKVSDAMYLPSVFDAIHIKGLDIFVASAGWEQYVENITESAVYYKRDSWKADWMLTLDDIRFVEILATTIKISHSYKISKTSLVKAYYICNQNGMFPKLEFYDTEFGKFFRMFLVKCTGLTNHGLLMNTQHYSKAEPPRFNAIMGPNYPLLKLLAYTQLKTDAEMILKIANEIRKDYIASFKDRDETTSTFNSKPKETKSFSFNL